MAPLKTTECFTLTIHIAAPHMIQAGSRMVFEIIGGTVKGDDISGTVLTPGADWTTVDSNGIGTIDVRTQIKMDDESIVYTSYNGRCTFDADGKLKNGYLVSGYPGGQHTTDITSLRILVL